MFGKHLADQYVGERVCALGQKPFQSEYGYTSISQAHRSTYSAYFCLSAQQAQLFTACERDSCQQPLRSSTLTQVRRPTTFTSLASAGFIWRCARLWSLSCVWWSQNRPCDWFKGQQMTLQNTMWPNERQQRRTAKHTSHMYVKENDTQAQPQTLACLNMSENVICNELLFSVLLHRRLVQLNYVHHLHIFVFSLMLNRFVHGSVVTVNQN